MRFHGNNILKFLDRTLGKIIVLLIGVIREKKRKLAIRNGKYKILIISINVMGDSLLLLPIINGISQLGFLEIHILSAPENFSVFNNWGVFKKLYIFRIKNIFSVLFRLNREKFDIIIDTCQWIRLSGIISGLIKANFKIGFNSSLQHRHYVYDLSVLHINGQWEFFNYLKLFAFLPIEKIDLKAELKSNIINDKKAFGRYILIHPGAGNLKKSWNGYNELIKIIIEKTDFNIVLTGKSRELSLTIHDKRIINMQDKTNLFELNQLVKDAVLVVCGNTGIMYMAMFNKTKLVTIPGPVSTQQWFWPGEQIEIISDIDCVPCVFFGFDYKCDSRQCLDYISPNMVFSVIEKYVNE